MAERFPCAQCGAQLEFAPGTTSLKCPYCGFVQALVVSTEGVVELPYEQWVHADVPANPNLQEVVCQTCAATFNLPPNQAAGKCPFCGGNIVLPPQQSGQIQPRALLPFAVDKKLARDKYKQWVSSRFWAPNDLKKLAMVEGGLSGVYVPYWTFDSFTITHYTGARGIDRIVTESYTDSDGNTQTRQRVETDWWPAAGTVQVPFDDVLVLASGRLPPRYAQAMKTWQLGGLVTYENGFLSGFQAVRYDVGLQDGFGTATELMQPEIDQTIRYDIGGDHQQIHTKDTNYLDTTFKHVLLPIWSGAYRYKGKTWNYLVNGQTGEIQGEAPISAWKVAIAVVLGLLLIGGIIYLYSQSKQH